MDGPALNRVRRSALNTADSIWIRASPGATFEPPLLSTPRAERLAMRSAAFTFQALILGLLTACSPADPPPTGPPPALRLRPSGIQAGPGATVQFQVDINDVPVPAEQFTWTVADTSLANIAPSGLLTVVSCLIGRPTTVRAVLKRDPSQQATAPITLIVPAVSLVQVQSINRATDHQPVDLGKVVGTVEVTIQSGGGLCDDIASGALAVSGPSGTSLLPPGRTWDPAIPSPVGAILSWNTTELKNGIPAFPDGDYTVIAVLRTRHGFQIPSNTIPLRVGNQ